MIFVLSGMIKDSAQTQNNVSFWDDDNNEHGSNLHNDEHFLSSSENRA